MQTGNTTNGYGVVAICLHWIMAVLVIGMLCLGLYMVDLPISLQKLKLFGWHKEFGVLVLMLIIVRSVWRLINITPSLASLPWWERWAALTMHLALYGFLFALPISGWLMTSASGLPVSFFGWFVLPNLVAPNENLRVLFLEIHQWVGYGLIAAIVAHAGAAFKHYLIDKDDILQRMFRS